MPEAEAARSSEFQPTIPPSWGVEQVIKQELPVRVKLPTLWGLHEGGDASALPAAEQLIADQEPGDRITGYVDLTKLSDNEVYLLEAEHAWRIMYHNHGWRPEDLFDVHLERRNLHKAE